MKPFLLYRIGIYKGAFITFFFAKEYDVKANPFVYSIEFTKTEKPRKRVYVEIKRLLSPSVVSTFYLTYETNVTNIDVLRTKGGIFKFIGENDNYLTTCFFKTKKDDNKLLFICAIQDTFGTYRLDKVNRLSLDFIDYNYNFTVNYQKEESYSRGVKSEYIIGVYPNILDFTSQNETNFSIVGYINYNLDKLTLNLESENLKCEANYKYTTIQCIVPKSHFQGKKSGYYYLYYTNFLGGKSLFYEVEPFKVILSGSIISFSINKIVYILSLLLLL